MQTLPIALIWLQARTQNTVQVLVIFEVGWYRAGNIMNPVKKR